MPVRLLRCQTLVCGSFIVLGRLILKNQGIPAANMPASAKSNAAVQAVWDTRDGMGTLGAQETGGSGKGMLLSCGMSQREIFWSDTVSLSLYGVGLVPVTCFLLTVCILIGISVPGLGLRVFRC